MIEETYHSRIVRKLTQAFAPILLDVVDDSARHKHHKTHPGSADAKGETHFKVKMIAPAFKNKSPLEKHRMVYDVLTDELRERVHALSLHVGSP